MGLKLYHGEKLVNTPKHVAIIMDGNGRWAKAQGQPRTFGHKAGAKNVELICNACKKRGVKYLTLYAFSTENWKRPAEEVSTIMGLLVHYLDTCLKSCEENKLRIRVIGDKAALDDKLKNKIAEVEEATAKYDELTLCVALNYGGRDEILRAIRRLNEQGLEVTEENFSNCLDTAGIPDPDLMIRTSGELRLSNYLPWQLTYSEFYFTDVAWPDFNEEELNKALDEYDMRHRRFGGV